MGKSTPNSNLHTSDSMKDFLEIPILKYLASIFQISFASPEASKCAGYTIIWSYIGVVMYAIFFIYTIFYLFGADISKPPEESRLLEHDLARMNDMEKKPGNQATKIEGKPQSRLISAMLISTRFFRYAFMGWVITALCFYYYTNIYTPDCISRDLSLTYHKSLWMIFAICLTQIYRFELSEAKKIEPIRSYPSQDSYLPAANDKELFVPLSRFLYTFIVLVLPFLNYLLMKATHNVLINVMIMALLYCFLAISISGEFGKLATYPRVDDFFGFIKENFFILIAGVIFHWLAFPFIITVVSPEDYQQIIGVKFRTDGYYPARIFSLVDIWILNVLVRICYFLLSNLIVTILIISESILITDILSKFAQNRSMVGFFEVLVALSHLGWLYALFDNNIPVTVEISVMLMLFLALIVVSGHLGSDKRSFDQYCNIY